MCSNNIVFGNAVKTASYVIGSNGYKYFYLYIDGLTTDEVR